MGNTRDDRNATFCDDIRDNSYYFCAKLGVINNKLNDHIVHTIK